MSTPPTTMQLDGLTAQAEQDYIKLVQLLAEGTNPSGDKISQVLTLAARSVADLRGDVARLMAARATAVSITAKTKTCRDELAAAKRERAALPGQLDVLREEARAAHIKVVDAEQRLMNAGSRINDLIKQLEAERKAATTACGVLSEFGLASEAEQLAAAVSG